MNNLACVRNALTAFLTCDRCGGSKMVAATRWSGHGTGRHGETHHSATAFEELSLKKHCICPGGPIWMAIAAKPAGAEMRFEEARRMWERNGSPSQVYIWRQGQWYTLPLDDWRMLLAEHWHELLGGSCANPDHC